MNKNKNLYKLIEAECNSKNNIIKIGSNIKKLNKTKIRKNTNKEVFYNLGKCFAILTAINMPELFFSSTKLINNKIIINFKNANRLKNHPTTIQPLTSIEICNDLLEDLCYRKTELYNDNSCSELIKYIKDNWKESSIFIYGFNKVYKYISLNKEKFSTILKIYLDESLVHLAISNIYKFNKFDLINKHNIIKTEFDRKLQLDFIEEKLEHINTWPKSKLIDFIFKIEHILINKSIIGTDENTINRSWIGFKKSQSISYDWLGFDYKNGILGITYFYIKLYYMTNNEYYLSIAEESVSKSNIESVDGIYKNINDLLVIYKLLYKATGKKVYNDKFSNLKFSNVDYQNRKSYFKKIYNGKNFSLTKNSQGEYFLSVENGLSGLGLYLIDAYLQ